jgi:hypothetical protein
MKGTKKGNPIQQDLTSLNSSYDKQSNSDSDIPLANNKITDDNLSDDQLLA